MLTYADAARLTQQVGESVLKIALKYGVTEDALRQVSKKKKQREENQLFETCKEN